MAARLEKKTIEITHEQLQYIYDVYQSMEDKGISFGNFAVEYLYIAKVKKNELVEIIAEQQYDGAIQDSAIVNRQRLRGKQNVNRI